MNFRNISGSNKSDILQGISFYWIMILVMIGILAPLIANDKPLIVLWNDNTYFPAFTGNNILTLDDPKTGEILKIDVTDPVMRSGHEMKIFMPLIPYYPNKSDMLNSGYVAPGADQFGRTKDGNPEKLSGTNKHLLGTGKRGEDVLSGLIHGTRISLTVGIFSMLIAGLIGITVGALAGYFGDYSLKISRSSLLMLITGFIPAWFYGFQMRSELINNSLSVSTYHFLLQMILSFIIFFSVIIIFNYSGRLLLKLNWMRKEINLPVDLIISRFIELFTSLPRLILIITIAAIAKPSIVNLILIIGFTSWTDIARLTRAEMLKVRNLDYIQSARGMGFKEWKIILYHGLPNAISPALVAISFGIASSILVESGLTFLGVGVPQDITTWGTLLYAGKENFNAWWLVIFPGMAIFMTVTAFNLAGEKLRDIWDPKTALKK